MPHAVSPSSFRAPVWCAVLSLALVVLGLAVAPPFVGPGWRVGLMEAFAWVCHQQPERSFAVDGVPLALCHRCTGIFAGFVVGLGLMPVLRRPLRRLARHARLLLVAALVPLTLDWGLGVAGLWASTPPSRMLTGLLFGLAAGLVAGRAIAYPPPRQA